MEKSKERELLIEDNLKHNGAITNLTLVQLIYETSSWKRRLEFIRDENIHLKNRLSEILKTEFNKDLLETVEKFHASFIKQDEVVSLLRNDVAELDELFMVRWFEDERSRDAICTKQNNLRIIIDNVAKQFCKLQFEFNEYFCQNL